MYANDLKITPLESAAKEVAPKYAVEYPLPAAGQTHELTVIDDRMIVLSQQSDSTLVKVALDDEGRPTQARSFLIGTPRSGLHGVAASTTHPGKIWLTLQFDSALVLIDPVIDDVNAAPIIEKYIKVPAPGRGPHVVQEYGNELWSSLKDSHHVLYINQDDPEDYALYPVSRTPVFVAKHPTSGDVYASIDASSKISRVHVDTGEVSEYSIPMDVGSTVVGLIDGPDGNVWFVLLGAMTGPTGTFGKVTADGEVHFIQLPNAQGKTAGLLHLAFPPQDKGPRLFLMSSSIGTATAINAVFDVTFDEGYNRIETISTVTLPTQYSKAHRVFHTNKGLYVTELSVSGICHIRTGFQDNLPVVDETSDYYADFGMGSEQASVDYLRP